MRFVDKRLSVGIRQETHEFLYQANLSNFRVLRVSIVTFTFDSKGNTTYMPVFAQNGSNLVCALVDTRSRRPLQVRDFFWLLLLLVHALYIMSGFFFVLFSKGKRKEKRMEKEKEEIRFIR